jgi:hypothetical protein
MPNQSFIEQECEEFEKKWKGEFFDSDYYNSISRVKVLIFLRTSLTAAISFGRKEGYQQGVEEAKSITVQYMGMSHQRDEVLLEVAKDIAALASLKRL